MIHPLDVHAHAAVEAYKRDASVTRIAEVLRCHVSTVRRWLRSAGVVRRKQTRHRRFDRKIAWALIDQLGYGKAAKHLGVSRQALYAACPLRETTPSPVDSGPPTP